jgi:AcrR family transcriptional regulator
VTSSRAGNGMARSRHRILMGAARATARYGTRKTTMSDIAREAGVAKATLYNHFRTKQEVYDALVASEIEMLVGRFATIQAPSGSAEWVAAMTASAAEYVAEHPVVRRLAHSEPEKAAALAQPGTTGHWRTVRREAMRRISVAQAAGSVDPDADPLELADILMRWILSHVLWPSPAETIRVSARVLVDGLRSSTAAAEPVVGVREAG